MKYTLLDMTQNILSSMDGEEVNSISDTAESRQVAEIIKTAYFNIISRANLPEHNTIFSLDASGDGDYPVLMYRPDNVKRIDWIKYNISESSDPNYAYVTILPIQQFLDMTQTLNPSEGNVSRLDLDDVVYYYRTDRHPSHCTILKDHIILFDSYNSDIESTLQESKTLCFGLISPTFLMEDSFVPDLDDTQFPLLLNEAKSLAFMEMKQTTHELAVLESRRQWRALQHSKYLHQPNPFDLLPDFGRRR